ncbi:MAG: 30S ribosomal protein S12 methylthiotransferase RimO [Lachnospiraceae bacterium]
MKLLFVSLGCDKNLVDSENMLGLLDADHVTITDYEDEADIIIINTCCFINDAKEESIQTILDMAEYKKSGNLKGLIVTGCLAQRYREEIEKEIPEVDAILGTNSYHLIVEAVHQVMEGHHYQAFYTLEGLPKTENQRLLTTGGHFAYLKIAEGCDKHCTYCIIPSIRGSYRSVDLDTLITQAKMLASQGVKELNLVAQETTLYGLDLYGKKMIGELLDQLNQISGIVWIRILYCYPEEIDDEFIDAIRRNSKVCHYLDMPIQHCSDTILKRMGRRTSKHELEEIISRIRTKIPDICLRTTLITGFPGETQEDHEEMLQFVNDMEFDRLGVFTYSAEEGTPAADFLDQLDEETKLNWRDELMELQQEVAFDKNETLKDLETWAIIEGQVADEQVYIARTYRDAPNIDGFVFIHTDEVLVTGDYVRVRITGAYEYDLIGELIDEFTK